MNLKSIVYFSLFGLTFFNGKAQNASDELLRINNVPYTVGEFERIYTKNLDLIKDEEQKNIDNYLDLFVLYKLKVNKAYDLGLDKRTEYINEFNTHRNQLAEQYFTNEETLNALAKEAYERSKYEIKASHIIFLTDEFGTPADTLKAYNKAMQVYNEIANGLDFNEAAKKYSEDPNAVNNFGDLGYFSVLRMVYPFENGAYNTLVGEVSLPVRSQFGYHLIKVNDKRLRKGKRDIAHIIVEVKKPEDEIEAKQKIDKVYDLLQKGSSFEELALEYSDDQTSKNSGGAFTYYEPGMLNINGFDDAVYTLNKAGEYSKPFKSQFGWQIVKLNAIQEIPSYDENKEFFLRKVQSDNRSRIIDNELVDHLKDKYKYKENDQNYKQFSKAIEKKLVDPNWKPSKDEKNAKVLATFADQKITTNDFEEKLYSNQFSFQNAQHLDREIKSNFNNLISEKVKKYYKDNLENEFPEFKNTAQEFKEGLLLFDLVDKEIWQKAKNDTIGYANYYKANLNKFKQPESIIGKEIVSNKKSDLKKVLKYENKNFQKSESQNNPYLDVNLIKVKEGKFVNNGKDLPKNYIFKQGVSEIIEDNGKYYIIVANQYFPEKISDLDEVKQTVIYDYQQDYEKNWIDDLKKNADIQINKPVLNQLKSKYNQN